MRNLERFAGIVCALALTGATASAQSSLSTIYAANNGGSSGGIVYFDLTMANPVLITAFDMNYDPGYAPTGQAVGLQVYTTPGTYVGNEGNASAWTQIGVDNGQATAAGVLNTPTNIPLAQPLLMQSGTVGMALIAVSAGHDYTNGNGTNQTYSDSFLTIQCGAAYNSPWGASPFTPRVWNGGIHYTPANGLYSNFTAATVSGPTPFTAQFTDTTFTNDPAGVQSWAWDLDGDGVVDSTIQNPQFTYNVCGYYDVTLTTTDTMNPPSTETKQGFIQADPQLLVVANFTSNTTGGSPPLTVQFTDSSTGAPTSWSWDLDGDNVIDSTVQNPSFTYTAGGGYNVSLTASNACGSDTVTKQNYIYIIGNDDCSGALPVTFGANGPFQNGGATTSAPAWPCANGGNDLWFSFTPTCTMNVTVDTCGSGFDTGLEIFDGSCALLNSLGCNDDSCGLQSSLDLLPAFGGTTYYIRVGGYSSTTGSFVLNITVSGNGSFSTIATGCGQATLDPTGSPNVGGGITYTMNSVQGTPLIWVGTIPLNNPICPAGCALGTTFDIVVPASSLGGPIPCMPFLQGAVFYTQGADLNAQGGCTTPAVPLPMTFTDTVVTTIG